MPHVQAGVISITVTLVPILTYAISIPLGLEKPEIKRIIGLVLGTLAILLIVIPENSLPETKAIPWILLSCLGSAFYAIEGIVIATKMPEKLNPIGVACIGNLLAVCFFMANALWKRSADDTQLATGYLRFGYFWNQLHLRSSLHPIYFCH